MRMTMKQPAITKHPNGTASFCLRAASKDGSMWQACTEEPQPIAKIIEMLTGDYIGYLRAMNGESKADEGR